MQTVEVSVSFGSEPVSLDQHPTNAYAGSASAA